MSTHAHDDFDFEPIRGLPALLPPGERLLWQGEPRWRLLARRAFHVRAVTIYFVLLLAWQAGTAIGDGRGVAGALLGTGWLATLASVAVGLLALMAWLYGRTTVYSITDKRLVLRYGVAIPVTINIPFNRIQSADLRSYADGCGDIALTLVPGERINYFLLWPNAQPWRISHARPMLRALPDAACVAATLADALASSAEQTVPRIVHETPRDELTDSSPPPLASAAR